MTTKRCILMDEKGKQACLVCPLMQCILGKAGITTREEELLLLVRLKDLNGKVYNALLERWVEQKVQTM